MNWLALGDYFFFIFHLLFILFVLTGWMIYRLRKVHLAVLLLTFSSWFILGIWYGIGFCPLTEWHWQILRMAGHRELPFSYVSFLIQRLTGIVPDDVIIDRLTAGLAVIALFFSVWVNFLRKSVKSNRQII
jgi:hypothetical protein